MSISSILAECRLAGHHVNLAPEPLAVYKFESNES